MNFRNTLVSPGSQLGQALKDRPKDKKLHNQIYEQTTQAFHKLYGADAVWFESIHKGETHV